MSDLPRALTKRSCADLTHRGAAGEVGGQWAQVEKGINGGSVGMLQGGREACEGKAPLFLGSPTAPAFYHLVLEHLAKLSDGLSEAG